MIGYFSINGRRIKNTILAYGREKMLRTALMGMSPESGWYIALLSQIDITRVADTATFANKNWTEFTDYTVSGDDGVRPTWTPKATQAVDKIVEYDEVSIISTATETKYIAGLLLCDRIYKDEIEYHIFSIAQAFTVEALYPNSTMNIGYTVAYE